MATPNPYVGPRPFAAEDRGRFFGRDGEVNQLVPLVYANRVLILFSRSGAGKTSLLQAGLTPALEKEGFQTFPAGRVSGLAATEKVANVYAFNAISSWKQHHPALDETLAEYLASVDHVADSDGAAAPRLIVFDQFEELFTAYPDRWQERGGFFAQVKAALDADPLLRVVFSMREELVGRLDQYLPQLYGVSMDRYQLERLRAPEALAAVTGPLSGDDGRRFGPGVAERLVSDLMRVRVERAGVTKLVPGEYVEPVQLQVVCETLWDRLPESVTEITERDLETFGDVDEALERFYDNAIARTATGARVGEVELRTFFGESLITRAGTRGTVHRGSEATAGIPEAAISALEDQHVIRTETQRGAPWIELAHDRFVGPIQASNDRWRHDRVRRRMRLAAIGLGALVLVAFVAGLLADGRDRGDEAPNRVAARVNPPGADFEPTVVGTRSTVAIELSNDGDVELRVMSIGTADPPFSADAGDCLGAELPVGSTDPCKIVLTFSPDAAEPATAPLKVTFEESAAGGATATTAGGATVTAAGGATVTFDITVELSGTGEAPLPPPVYRPGELAFGSLPVAGGSPATEQVSLTNRGARTMTITSVTIEGSADFRREEGGCENRFLVRDSACLQSVTFEPTATGRVEATLRIEWSDELGPSGVADLALVGFGAPPPPEQVAVDFDEVAVGGSLARSVDLRSATGSIEIADVFSAGPFTIGDQCDGVVIVLGRPCSVTVEFTPVTTGVVAGDVFVSYRGGEDEPAVEADVGGLLGIGVAPQADVLAITTILVEPVADTGPFVAVAADRRAAWASEFDRGRLVRVDAATEETTPIQLDEPGPPATGRVDGVAIGPDAVWAVAWDGTLYRVDPETLEISPSRIAAGTGRTLKLSYGFGRLWVVDEVNRAVYEVDPATGEAVGDAIPVGDQPVDIAVGTEAVWVSDLGSGQVWALHPDDKRTRPVRVGAAPVGVAVGDGFVWVANRDDGTVSRIEEASFAFDGATKPAVGTIGVGRVPDGVAVGDDSVWITNRGDATVSRIDLRTFAVTVLPDPEGDPVGLESPDGIAVGPDSVWVANGGGAGVTRIELEPVPAP